MKHGICEIDFDDAKKFADSITRSENMTCVTVAEESLLRLKEEIETVLKKARELKQLAESYYQWAKKEYKYYSNEYEREKKVLDSIPPVLIVDTKEKDKYGNHIMKTVNNSAKINVQKKKVAELYAKAQEMEKKKKIYVAYEQDADKLINEYISHLYFADQRLQHFALVKNGLSLRLQDIKTKADRAIGLAYRIMNQQIVVNFNGGTSYISQLH